LEVRLREKGRVTIPATLRRDLGLVEGESLELTAKDGSLVIKPKKLTTVAQIKGIAGHKKVKLEDVESALGKDTS
jgi:AbrB family looped-hinge helix DNA binding protein